MAETCTPTNLSIVPIPETAERLILIWHPITMLFSHISGIVWVRGRTNKECDFTSSAAPVEREHCNNALKSSENCV